MELIKLDHTGHTSVLWEADHADAIARAQALFTEAISEGYLAYTTDEPGGGGTVIKAFNPFAERTVLAPPLVGG